MLVVFCLFVFLLLLFYLFIYLLFICKKFKLPLISIHVYVGLYLIYTYILMASLKKKYI